MVVLGECSVSPCELVVLNGGIANGGKKLVLIWRTGFLSYHCNGLWCDGLDLKVYGPLKREFSIVGMVRDFVSEYQKKYDKQRRRMCIVALNGMLDDDEARCLEVVLNNFV
ncbi:hypothetical protein SNEBB_002937 [Seison nebaliae]|nr:hypothetical protein SNEBB_002937 [Seison nebaliae]